MTNTSKLDALYIYHEGRYTVPTAAQLDKLAERENKKASKPEKALASVPGYMPGVSPAVLKAATAAGSAYAYYMRKDTTCSKHEKALNLESALHNLACLTVFKKMQAMRRKDWTYTPDIDGFTAGTAEFSRVSGYVQTLEECAAIMSSPAWERMVAHERKSWREYADDTRRKLADAGRLNASGLVSAAKECAWEILHAAHIAGTLTPCQLVKPCYSYDERTTRHADGSPTASEKWAIYRTSGVRIIGAAVAAEMRRNRAIRADMQAWDAIERTDENGNTYTEYSRITSVIGASCAGFDDGIVEKLAALCDLTPTEYAVLTMHYCGAWYDGYKDNKTGKTVGACMRIWTLAEIAENRGLTEKAVEKASVSLKRKIANSGYFANKIHNASYEPENNVKKCRKIGVYMANDESKEIFAIFTSIGAAAKILDIDKGGISKVVNGKKASIKGMIFKYVD